MQKIRQANEQFSLATTDSLEVRIAKLQQMRPPMHCPAWDTWVPRNLMHEPRHPLNRYGRRAFVIAGPSTWNSLPDPVRNPNSTETAFRRLLKTFACSAEEAIKYYKSIRNSLCASDSLATYGAIEMCFDWLIDWLILCVMYNMWRYQLQCLKLWYG